MLKQFSQSEENIKQIELDLIAFEHKIKMLNIELRSRKHWLQTIKVMHQNFDVKVNLDEKEQYINSLKQMLNKY